MEVKQIYEIMNSITNELLGESALVKEDLSNIVELGQQFENVVGLDNYVKRLPDHIGRVVFVNRSYNSRVPSVLMDGWEFGSILEKIAARIPEAVENEEWSLQDGASYDPNVFHAPDVYGSFWNKRVTFEIDMSITEDQVKSSFSSVTQLNGFLSMILTAIENSLSIKLDGLIMRTINNMIGQTLLKDAAAFTPVGETDPDYGSASTLRAVNLLKLYNTEFDTNLEAADALTTPAFIRYSAYVLKLYKGYLTNMSTKFNIDGLERFTEEGNLRTVLLNDLAAAHEVYLESDTYHNDMVKLPEGYQTVPFWQGSGVAYDFESKSTIHIDVADATQEVTGKTEIEITGVVGVMFSRYACGVNQYNRRVTTHLNAKAEFVNNFYKTDANYWNALDEDFVVFFIADPAA